MSTRTFLIAAFAIRVLLDVTGAFKPGWRLEIANCVLFGAAAAVSLAEVPRNFFGYVCMLLAVGWGVRAFIVFRRRESQTLEN